MSPARRRHLHFALLLMMIGAVAELLTIGAILPFLALISDPAAIERVPVARWAFELIGWRKNANLLIPATILLAVVAAGSAGIRLVLTWVSQKFIFRLGHE